MAQKLERRDKREREREREGEWEKGREREGERREKVPRAQQGVVHPLPKFFF